MWLLLTQQVALGFIGGSAAEQEVVEEQLTTLWGKYDVNKDGALSQV